MVCAVRWKRSAAPSVSRVNVRARSKVKPYDACDSPNRAQLYEAIWNSPPRRQSSAFSAPRLAMASLGAICVAIMAGAHPSRAKPVIIQGRQLKIEEPSMRLSEDKVRRIAERVVDG